MVRLSIVVVCYDMRREAERTLYSLSPSYQQGVDADEYEIIVIDNGSSSPLDPDRVASFGSNIRYHFHATDSVSPAAAVNLGASMAIGSSLAVIVDGARMATPGLLRYTLDAVTMKARVFACALSWHLGPDIQPRSIQQGYDQAEEDEMLRDVRWHEDGYRLFSVATLAPSSRHGFLGEFPSECSWFAMSRDDFNTLGGFNEAFQMAGGGLCNQEFRNRALAQRGVTPCILLGEGLFHQVHGGAATNAPPDRRPHLQFAKEYRRITGHDFTPIPVEGTIYLGTIPTMARNFLMGDLKPGGGHS